MRWLAALSGGVFAYLTVGALTGHAAQTLSCALRGRRTGERVALRRGGRVWLEQAGASVSLSQFVGVSVGIGVVAFAVTWVVSGAPSVGLVPALVLAQLPRTWFARQRARLARERLAAWPDALRQLVAHLEAPMSLHRSLCELGRSGPEPLRPYWSRYTVLTSALDARAALEALREQLADPVSDRVFEVLLVAHEQGAGLVVDILRGLAAVTTKDIRLLEQIETAQLEQRIEARSCAVLPFAVLVLLCASAPAYRQFYGSPAGFAVIVIGAAMALGGMVIIDRLGRLSSEERVLGASGGGAL